MKSTNYEASHYPLLLSLLSLCLSYVAFKKQPHGHGQVINKFIDKISNAVIGFVTERRSYVLNTLDGKYLGS
jgi:hypothetical protein